MTVLTTVTRTWLDDWQDWRRQRLAEVTADHGVASLTATVWLSSVPQAVPGIPGTWLAVDGEAHGVDGTEHQVIAVGQSLHLGHRLVRVIARSSAIGLRVFDPAAPSRTSIAEIAVFAPDEHWQLTGRFEPASVGSTRSIEHVGGSRTDDPVAGIIRIVVGDEQLALLALPTPDGRLQVTFTDTTNGVSTAQFRFLSLPRSDTDGLVPVDFNRAYLPPCAFSDHYLCPLPPPENRLPFPVTAGETVILRFPTD